MVLDAIVQRQRETLEVERARRDETALRARAAAAAAPLDFAGAIKGGPTPALIAECKRRSPIKGLLREDYDVARIAVAYQAGGASTLSILTNPDFDGELEHLAQARGAVGLPLLRKDFVIDPFQLLEARAYGADCVLLIARILEAGQLQELVQQAQVLGMQAMVEVYDEAEVEAAVAAEPDLLGVNNRDLATFELNPALFARVAPQLPAGLPMVAESGIATRADVLAAKAAGARAVLVGESLMRAYDPARKARELLGLDQA